MALTTRTRRVQGVAGAYSSIRTRTRAISGTIPTVSLKTRTRRLSGSVPTPFDVTIDSDVPLDALEPGTVVTLTAEATGGTATGWAWSASDARVVLTGADDERSFVVPAVMNGLGFTVTVVATGTGAAAGSATVDGAALPHNAWTTSPTGWVPLMPALL